MQSFSFDLFPNPPVQRHSPASIAAGEQIKHRISDMQHCVLEYIRAHGRCTDEQQQVGLCMNGNTQRARRIELARMGLVERDGYSRTRAGRIAQAWRAKRG